MKYLILVLLSFNVSANCYDYLAAMYHTDTSSKDYDQLEKDYDLCLAADSGEEPLPEEEVDESEEM